MKRKGSRAAKLLSEMRRNPKVDWRIEQLDTVARAYEVNVRQGRGSHVLFEHPKLVRALSVPARRPIKPVCIRRFVALIEDSVVISASKGALRDEMTRLEYPFAMSPLSEEEGGGYLIEFPDLPGCMSDGATPEEALHNGADAVRCWIEAMREAGRPIPAPSKAAVGKRTISVGSAVYQIIAEEAQRQGLNVDTIADSALIYGSSALLDRIESRPPKVRSSKAR